MNGLTEIDRGWNKIKAEMLKAKGSFVKVGILGDAQDYEGGTSTAEVAVIHEFGAPNKKIPSRPFMRQAIDRNAPKLRAYMGNILKFVLGGKVSTRTALSKLGLLHQRNVRDIFTSGTFAPLKPATIRRKKGKGLGRAEATLARARKKSELNDKDMQRVLKANEVINSQTTPLIDTGHMRKSITYDVVMK